MNFEYLRARDLSEAIMMLNRFGEDSKILAGGTELFVNMKQHAIAPKYLIDIKSITKLSYIKYDEEGVLRIGALTPLRAIERSHEIRDRHPIIVEAVRSIATLQIKNVATIGGNLCQTVKCPYFNQSHINLFMRQSLEPCRQRGGSICHASRRDTLGHSILGKGANGCFALTASDLATPLIALKASVKAVGPNGERFIPIEHFFIGGGRNALQRNEIITEVQIPSVHGITRSKYQKYAQDVRNFSILILAAIIWLTLDKKACKDIRIVLGGMGVIPLKLDSLEERLKNGEVACLRIEDSVKNELEGIKTYGTMSEYKLRRAGTMIIDVVKFLIAEEA